MTIRPDEIAGELALELDADLVTAADFIGAVESFISILKEVTQEIDNKIPADGWLISVQSGSQVVNVSPNPLRIPPIVSGRIVEAVAEGFEALGRAAETPPHFSEKAVEDARKLAKFAMRKSENRFPLRVLTKQRSRPMTREIFNHASDLLDARYEDYGTVEGNLEAVSSHGRYEFRIYEPIWQRAIRCFVDEKVLDDALTYFRKRVEVQGLIRYSREGLPTSVRVDSIILMPEAKDLPHYSKLRGILGVTDGA